MIIYLVRLQSTFLLFVFYLFCLFFVPFLFLPSFGIIEYFLFHFISFDDLIVVIFCVMLVAALGFIVYFLTQFNFK